MHGRASPSHVRIYGATSVSNPITEPVDLSVNWDVSEFESSGLPALCADDSTAAAA